jgi:hypothetical protein
MQEASRMPTVLCIDDNAEALKIRKRMLETECSDRSMCISGGLTGEVQPG